MNIKELTVYLSYQKVFVPFKNRLIM